MSDESKATAAERIRDGMLVGGYGLLVAGVWMIYMPAGLIVAGSILLVAGVAGVLRS